MNGLGTRPFTAAIGRPARRSGNKVFTRFFYKKIAGAGQSPAAVRVGRLSGEGLVQGRTRRRPRR